jgi:hypothetical protein
MKGITQKLKTCMAILFSETYVAIARRGSKATIIGKAPVEDEIWEVAFEQAAERFYARAVDDMADEAVQELKKQIPGIV